MLLSLAEEREATQYLENVIRFIENGPLREGMLETPERIVRSWRELFNGYTYETKEDFAKLLTVFENQEKYDQIITLKNIQVYSMCEHHWLPFIGKAHVGYIPNEKVIVGISKIARLVDALSRRFQIQENLTDLVTYWMEELLQPKGVICVIEAEHYCMRMRGCSQQESTMITSSLRGVFKEDTAARQEFFTLIKGER